MFFDPKRAFSENREKTVAGRAGSPKANIYACLTRCVRSHPPLLVAPVFACDVSCVRYACAPSWFFALTSSFPVFPVSFRRRAKYTAGVSSSDVKMKIT